MCGWQFTAAFIRHLQKLISLLQMMIGHCRPNDFFRHGGHAN